MSSVFLEIPKDRWVAENGLAFAIRDGFPVSEGHTLVITRREVQTWFEATPEERLAVLELVEAVKLELDATLKPDGYNVGFNAGAVAGQTVMHLHVHVIPRYRGDMDDPRGGVRHVIPSKGNYKRSVRGLATGGDDDPFLRHITPLFDRADEIAIVAAFVQSSGLSSLRRPIDRAIARGAQIRLLTGDYLNITQAAALEELLDWITAGVADDADPTTDEESGSLDARVIEVDRMLGGRAFHPKAWRFEAKAFGVLFVGSSNISRSALERGVEWNLRVDRDADGEAYERAVGEFDALWRGARVIDTDWIRDYAARARLRPLELPPGEEDPEPLPTPPEPHDVQREALDQLRRTREQGHERGLVVLATGLGKTWLSAFDVAAFADERLRMPRVLFLAHRREILRQAAHTFRTMLRPRFADARIGWFVGPGGTLDADFLFASVQKLGRRDQLAKLAPGAFDYVIVDEVHHATADSYRRILDHLQPEFVLGLTATPERTDEADVLGLFDDNLVMRAGLDVGIEVGRLVPFDYYGLKDAVDYASIPWRNRRFDPAELAAAVQTERRMEQLFAAWNAHPAERTLVFCASVAHARFVRDWLRERGVEARAVHSGEGSDPRDESMDGLAEGRVDAVCSVDVFNEGVDVPNVDRVVMLRPTESPVVFLQQLGRGLRKPTDEEKDRLTVIDFVGNHRVFLERVRRLLSFGGSDRGLSALVDSAGVLELPFGCTVDVEIEVKDMLRQLVPRGGSEVERVYRELRESRGARPRAGELSRMGYLPSTLRKGAHRSWFDFVASEGDLDPAEREVLEVSGAWLRDLEKTQMTKSFKMVVVEALLEADALESGLTLDALARRSHAVLRRSPELFRDVQDGERFAALTDDTAAGWLAYWRKNPIAAWTNPGKSKRRTWFRVEGERFVPTIPIPAASSEAFVAMTRELVDYRLAGYRVRHAVSEDAAGSFDCRITWNQGDPILKLPSRRARPNLPEGDTDARLPNGSVWTFRFRKEFCNVARPVAHRRNRLPDLMRQWFGPNAGHPATDFRVRFELSPDGYWIHPLGQVIELPVRGRFVSYPDLRAAAGAAEGTHDHLDADDVVLPLELDGEDLFAIRATGGSMDGGREPIRDGDWLLMRFSRGAPLPAVEGRVALVQVADESFGQRFQIKRIVRTPTGWRLKSENPDAPSYDASPTTTPVATLVSVVRPETLAPDVGARLEADEVGPAFGLEETIAIGRFGGHLFLALETPGDLDAPDRARAAIEPKPGETAFVLTRADETAPWRYAGVGRWRPTDETWAIPPVDYPTWKALGRGRGASRRLPDGDEDDARALARALLSMHPPGSWVERDGRRCRIVRASATEGVRVDGGDDGFGERTVSVTDLAWALVARDDVATHGGVLDEARVNRLRYLEGTPKSATRWIDTGWALVLLANAELG